MFQSSGSMYEEIENARLKKKRHQMILIRRIIAIVLLSLIVIYLLILFIDTRRFKNGKYPLITTKVVTKEYDDGKVTSYYSIGWIFRFYERETIKDSEIVPFYKDIRLDNVLKRENDPNLPERETDYKVPKNTMKQEKIDNVLFFYNGDDLLGTYACLLSKSDCEISISDTLDDDIDTYKKIKMGIIDNRYVFITEYKNKDTEAEEKHIYLYDITAENYIAEYEGVRYTKLEGDKGYIDSSKYIVKKNGYWGIDQVIKGKVSNFEDYNYTYISYDEDTKLYIFKKKNDTWVAFNSNDKVYTAEFDVKINDLYYVNNKIYVVTYDKNYRGKFNYKLYNQDAINVLEKEDIDDLKAFDNYLTYTNDNKLYLIDYDGNPLASDIEIYLPSYMETSKTKQYEIIEKNDTVVIKVPKSTESTHYVDEYYYNKNTWELTNKRTPQETVSYD